MKICIDPGHYKDYNHGVISEYYEGNAMFYLSDFLKTHLERLGASVILTKTFLSQNPTLQDRGKKAKNCDVFISLHSNAGPENAKGVEVFYSVKRPSSKGLAVSLCNSISEKMNTTNRGVKTKLYPGSFDTDYYGVIRSAASTNCPNIFIIEHGFHTNKKECAFLLDTNNLDELAKIEAELIYNYCSGKNEGEIELNMTQKQLKDFIKETIKEVNPVYAELKNVPSYWYDFVKDLLDTGAVNGGTPSDVNPNDVNLSRETLQGIIVGFNYAKKKFNI